MRGVINIISGFFPPVANALVGLVLTPLILSRLGMESYSYWPLCNTLTLYVGMVTISLGPGLRRHTVFALDQGNLEEAKEYFNTGLGMTTGFWLLLLLVGTLFSIFLPSFIVIKPALKGEVQLMFFLTALAASLEVFILIFFIGAYARNKIYTERIARIISPVSRFLVIWVAFTFWPPSIKMLGIAALIGSALTLAIAVITCYLYLPELRIDFKKYFNSRAMRTLAAFSGWIFCVGIGDFIFRSLHLLLANRLFNPVEAGRYGIVLQVISIITLVTGHVGYVLSRKLILALSSKADKEANKALSSYYTWSMSALALPLSIIFINADYIFSLWLHEHSQVLINLFKVAVLSTFLVEPLSMVNTYLLASKRLSSNGISTILMGPCLLFLSMFAINYLHLGIIGIAIASGLVILLRNTTLLIDAFLSCNLSLKGILQGLSVSFLAFSIVLMACYMRRMVVQLDPFPSLAADVSLGLMFWSFILWSLSPDCRDLARSLVRMITSNRGALTPL